MSLNSPYLLKPASVTSVMLRVLLALLPGIAAYVYFFGAAVLSWLAPPAVGGEKCSLVFVDPPYKMSREMGGKWRLVELLKLLPEQITKDGLVVVRTEEKVNLLDSYGQLKIIDKRVWSSMTVAFLAMKNDEQTSGNTDNSQSA